MSGPYLTEDNLRAARAEYDALAPGDRSALRRCRDPNEVMLEGAYWQIVAAASGRQPRLLAAVVACFPTADQRRGTHAPFRTGTFLRHGLHPNEKRVAAADALRFRQVLMSRSRDELVHRLRRVLRHVALPVDWGVLGRDIVTWGPGGPVCRRWAQDFYAPGTDAQVQQAMNTEES